MSCHRKLLGQHKTWDLRKFRNFKKIPEVIETDDKYPVGILTVALNNCEKSAVKHFRQKSIFFLFLNLLAILYPNCLRKHDCSSNLAITLQCYYFLWIILFLKESFALETDI